MFAGRAKGSMVAAVIAAVLAAIGAFAMMAGTGLAHGSALASRATGPAAPLRVLSISPGNGARQVNGSGPVQVVFSAALAPASPLPAFSPAVAGQWHVGHAGTMVFMPAAPFEPATEVTLRIPAGRSGVRSAAGGLLAMPVTAVFQTGGWSTLRVEELLAQTGYLPLSWAPDAGFSWKGRYPSALTSQWRPGVPGPILTGALMAFESDHGLPMTGIATSDMTRALFQAVTKGQDNPHGYTYALASQVLPETLTVWHEGQVVMHGLANTGTPASPTAVGTFPVYLRYRSQVMRGTMPDGTPYADPVQFVSYFNGGDAVHSFNRVSYGFPQSLGCVELPLSSARQVWPYLTYGSLVTVTR